MNTPVNILVRDIVLRRLLDIVRNYDVDHKAFIPACELLMKHFPDVLVEQV